MLQFFNHTSPTTSFITRAGRDINYMDPLDHIYSKIYVISVNGSKYQKQA